MIDLLKNFLSLLQYRLKHCPDFDGDYSYYVYFDWNTDKWNYTSVNENVLITVCFPKHIAKKLSEELNSGKFEIGEGEILS